MVDELSDGDICGEWVYVGDSQEHELVSNLMTVLEKI